MAEGASRCGALVRSASSNFAAMSMLETPTRRRSLGTVGLALRKRSMMLTCGIRHPKCLQGAARALNDTSSSTQLTTTDTEAQCPCQAQVVQGFQDKLGALQGPQSSDKPLSQAGPSGTQQFNSPHCV